VKRLLVALVLLMASPAQAAPPELFVRQQRWDTHEETGPWLPLLSAPVLGYLGGYEVGYRLQAAGFQRVSLMVTGVPDGAPTQPGVGEPYCVGRSGAVGDIVPAGAELQFEGVGTYAVKVSVGGGGPSDCLSSGESATGSFGVSVGVAPVLVGAPLSFRAVPVSGFVGVRADAPPGGQAEVQCSLGATMLPVSFQVTTFPRPGVWTCLARGVAEGRDDGFETTSFATPWSAPLSVEVLSDFRRSRGTISGPRSARPRFSIVAEFPAEASGGSATVRLYRVRGCKRHAYKLTRVASYRGRFDAKRMRVTVRRPRAAGYYFGRLTFAGTRFLRAGDDVNPMLLQVGRGRLEYVAPRDFPPCS
jgi:hypothetical protein